MCVSERCNSLGYSTTPHNERVYTVLGVVVFARRLFFSLFSSFSCRLRSRRVSLELWCCSLCFNFSTKSYPHTAHTHTCAHFHSNTPLCEYTTLLFLSALHAAPCSSPALSLSHSVDLVHFPCTFSPHAHTHSHTGEEKTHSLAYLA